MVAGRDKSTSIIVAYTGEWDDFEVEVLADQLKGVRLKQKTRQPTGSDYIRRLMPGSPPDLQLPRNVRAWRLVFEPCADAAQPVEGQIVIGTNVDGYEEFLIPVKGRIHTAIRAYPNVLNCGVLSPEDKVKRRVTLVSMIDEEFEIIGIDSVLSDLRCTYPTVSSKNELDLDFTIPGTAGVLDSGTAVTVRTRLKSSGDELKLFLKIVAWAKPAVDI
jgi:hypothetical protein